MDPFKAIFALLCLVVAVASAMQLQVRYKGCDWSCDGVLKDGHLVLPTLSEEPDSALQIELAMIKEFQVIPLMNTPDAYQIIFFFETGDLNSALTITTDDADDMDRIKRAMVSSKARKLPAPRPAPIKSLDLQDCLLGLYNEGYNEMFPVDSEHIMPAKIEIMATLIDEGIVVEGISQIYSDFSLRISEADFPDEQKVYQHTFSEPSLRNGILRVVPGPQVVGKFFDVTPLGFYIYTRASGRVLQERLYVSRDYGVIQVLRNYAIAAQSYVQSKRWKGKGQVTGVIANPDQLRNGYSSPEFLELIADLTDLRESFRASQGNPGYSSSPSSSSAALPSDFSGKGKFTIRHYQKGLEFVSNPDHIALREQEDHLIFHVITDHFPLTASDFAVLYTGHPSLRALIPTASVNQRLFDDLQSHLHRGSRSDLLRKMLSSHIQVVSDCLVHFMVGEDGILRELSTKSHRSIELIITRDPAIPHSFDINQLTSETLIDKIADQYEMILMRTIMRNRHPTVFVHTSDWGKESHALHLYPFLDMSEVENRNIHWRALKMALERVGCPDERPRLNIYFHGLHPRQMIPMTHSPESPELSELLKVALGCFEVGQQLAVPSPTPIGDDSSYRYHITQHS